MAQTQFAFLIAEAAAAEAPEAEGGLLTAMATDPSWFAFYGVVAFLVLVWRMGGFTAMTAALDERGQKIAADLKEAARLRQEAEALLASYEAKRVAAESEAREIVSQAERDAEALRQQAARELTEELARRDRQAEDRIRRAETQAAADVRAAAVDAAIATAERMLRAELNDGRQTALIERGVAELAGKLR